MSSSGKRQHERRTGGGRRARRRAPPRRAVAALQPVTSAPTSVTVPAVGLAQAGERLDELVLAVAGDAGDAEDLAGPDLEVDAADGLAAAVVLARAGRGPRAPSRRVRLAAIDRELDLAADHELGQVVLVRLGRDPLSRRRGRAG